MYMNKLKYHHIPCLFRLFYFIKENTNSIEGMGTKRSVHFVYVHCIPQLCVLRVVLETVRGH